MRFAAEITQDIRPQMGLVVLQADETIEDEFRATLTPDVSLLVTRIPSGEEVSADSLAEMKNHLGRAVSLFPSGKSFDVIGYACTSATAEIGADNVAAEIGQSVSTRAVTDPLSALVAACRALDASRIAFLSPYVEDVSAKIRDRLERSGIATPIFGSFSEAEEARVARISEASIKDAARQLLQKGAVDALFTSCTNLRTAAIRHSLGQEFGLPVLSSNSVLAWHMLALSSASPNGLRPDAV